VLEEFKLYEEFYRERGRHPSKAIPQDVFVANLKARRDALAGARASRPARDHDAGLEARAPGRP
jgi:hypothetical protein